MKVIAVDFDGTLIVNDRYRIVSNVPLAFEVCRELQASGNSLVLFTMRTGEDLEAAVNHCTQQGLTGWHGLNENPDQFSGSRKVYADLYIDNRAVGCPLIEGTEFVDWAEVRNQLLRSGVIREECLAKGEE